MGQRKSWGGFGLLLASLMLAGCGGGNEGFSGGGGNTPPGEEPILADGIRLLADSAVLPSTADSADEGVEITAIAVDDNNRTVQGATIEFSSSSGVIVQSEEVTGADGSIRATLHTGGSPAPRTIVVTASSGDQAQAINILVVTQSGGGAGGVASVAITTGSAQLPSNATTAGADGAITVTAFVRDGNNNGVANIPVTIAATSGQLVSVQTMSNSDGLATAVLTTGGNPTPRVIVLTASANGMSSSIQVQVVPQGGGATVTAVSATVSSPQLPSTASAAGSPGVVTVTAFVRDAGNNGVAEVPVSFTSNSGQLVNVQPATDANGQATAVLTTGGNPTPRTISVTVTAGNISSATQVEVVPDVAGTAVRFLNLNPNTGTLASTATDPADGLRLTATALDMSNRPVPNVTVLFSASTGGALAEVNATTDANGRASAVLTIGSNTPPSAITVTSRVGAISANATIAVLTATDPVASITLLTSSPELPSAAVTSEQGVTISAIVRDSLGNLVPDVVVTFSAPNAAVQTMGPTDETGTARAILTTGGDAANRIVTVNATASGIASNPVQVEVSGTRLEITGPDAISVGMSGEFGILLEDSAGMGVPGRTVAIASTTGNLPSPAMVVTDFNGAARFTYTAGAGGLDTLTATGAGATADKAVTVVTRTVQIPDPAQGAAVNFGDCRAVTAQFTDPGSTANVNIAFSTTRGFFFGNASCSGTTLGKSTVVPTTTSNGARTATLFIRSNGSDGAGEAVISATVQPTGPGTTRTLVFIATDPSKVTVQASPSTIPVGGSSIVTAVVRDASNNFVAGRKVNFFLTDVSSGSLSAPDGITDSLGRVSVTFNASDSSSGTDDVTVTARDELSGISGSAILTVGGQALFITLGTGNQIEEPNATVYRKPFSVVVTDSAGNPAPPSTEFRLSIISVSYQKGAFIECADPGGWIIEYTIPGPFTTGSYGLGCASEDTNTNGILDPGEDLNSEDTNGNGVLDPGEDVNFNRRLDPNQLDPANVVSVPSTLELDENGTVEFGLIYPQDRANWTKVTLRAIASVAGTESFEDTTFVLDGLASDFTDCDVSPPGQISPYGTGGSCASIAEAQCSDGVDNDGDGRIDLAGPDPGCFNDPLRNQESPDPPPPAP